MAAQRAPQPDHSVFRTPVPRAYSTPSCIAVICPQLRPNGGWRDWRIFFLLLLATYFMGKNLSSLSNGTANKLYAFGQKKVSRWIVLPLTASAFLLTLLSRAIMAYTFGLNLALTFLVSGFLFLVLALTFAFAGEAPLCYLKTHHRTSGDDSVRDFWNGPKVLCTCEVCLRHSWPVRYSARLAAAAGSAWIAGSIILLAKLWSVAGLSPVAGRPGGLAPPLMLGGILVTILFVTGLLGRMFDNSRREWLARLAGCIGMVISCYGVCLLDFLYSDITS